MLHADIYISTVLKHGKFPSRLHAIDNLFSWKRYWRIGHCCPTNLVTNASISFSGKEIRWWMMSWLYARYILNDTLWPSTSPSYSVLIALKLLISLKLPNSCWWASSEVPVALRADLLGLFVRTAICVICVICAICAICVIHSLRRISGDYFLEVRGSDALLSGSSQMTEESF